MMTLPAPNTGLAVAVEIFAGVLAITWKTSDSKVGNTVAGAWHLGSARKQLTSVSLAHKQ
jgi:hypothetical protein